MKESLADMYRRGLDIRDIAAKENLPWTTVRDVLLDSGVTLRAIKQRPMFRKRGEKDDAILLDRSQGMTRKEVCAKYGITDKELSTVVQRFGDRKRYSKISSRRTEIIADYKNGFTVPMLAKKYNCTNGSISRVLRSGGFVPAFTRKVFLQHNEVAVLHSRGVRAHTIAKLFGIHENTVYQIVRKARDSTVQDVNLRKGEEVRSNAYHDDPSPLRSRTPEEVS